MSKRSWMDTSIGKECFMRIQALRNDCPRWGQAKISVLTMGSLFWMVLLVSQHVVAEDGTGVPGWTGKTFAHWPTHVDAEAVTVEGKTDILWKPKPYAFRPGASTRYIDCEGGDDANAGDSKDAPWKHHPWDPEAGGNAKAAEGVHTYVFKGGVIYRGRLIADESGTTNESIRLLRDPDWGAGEAVIAGSVGITGGWHKVAPDEATAAGFPEESHNHLWAVKLDGEYVPRAVWVLKKDGARERLPLARWPNRKIEHKYNHFTQWLRVDKVNKGFPRTKIYSNDLKGFENDAFNGATIWVDHANTSGEFSIIGPFPSDIGNYSPEKGMMTPAINHPARHPNPNAPFFLENRPRFLDEAGEWYFSEKGDNARTLYVRLPGDLDPNTATIEAARHEVILDIQGQRHIEVAGLTFTGGNAFDLRDAPRAGNHDRPCYSVLIAAIRLQNDSQAIRLHHLAVRDTAGSGIANYVTEEGAVLRDIEVADSEISSIDNTAIDFKPAAHRIRFPYGRIRDIRLLRNRLTNIGFRCSIPQGGSGFDLNSLEVGEIAGNVIHRTAAQGINVVGGRFGIDTPLIRILIHHNRVSDTLIHKTDFGGIEFWSVGSCYVYNNISANPVGFVAHRNIYHKNQAYYFDHGCKAYLFNNIGWSDKGDEYNGGVLGSNFLQEVRNRWNQCFQNTAYSFSKGQNCTGSHGDQQHYLANLFIDCYSGAASHWRLDDAAELAYANNIFAGNFDQVYNRWKGDTFVTPGDFAAHIAKLPNHLSDHPGWGTDEMPVRDPDARDFRPTDKSAAIDRGVKVFVPWSLAGTVGEWHFRLHPKDPNTVLPYDVYIQPFHQHHESLRMGSPVPENELTGNGFTADAYVDGPLEDWVKGAVTFDGTRHLTLAQATLLKNFSISEGHGKHKKTTKINGTTRKTVRMDTNNFLIEAVIRAGPEQAGAILAGKPGDTAGYALGLDPSGKLTLQLNADGANVTQASKVAINDSRWHHVLAEVDRAVGAIRLYIDGDDVTGVKTGTMPAANASLDNAVDFVVGKDFVGAMDYLRVSRGTLADAQTSIEELMAWQFNGPQDHDFAGRAPTGDKRDAGALEHPTISGLQEIRYTPPVIEDKKDEAPPAEADAVEFKTGPDRTVKAYDWGSVSVPKTVKPGEYIDFQIVFGTETVAKDQLLVLDLHGWKKGKRVPGVGQNYKKPKVVPGVTVPYESSVKMPGKEKGFDRVNVIFYLSPDGSWANKTLSGSVPVAYPEPDEE